MKIKVENKLFAYILLISIFLIFFISNILAYYNGDVYFSLPDSVYTANESIELKGYAYLANFTTNTVSNASLALTSTEINLTITNANGDYYSNYTFVTDSKGAFYSRSNYYSNATQVLAPLVAGDYNLRVSFKDPLNATKFSDIDITVINQTLDSLSVSPNKANYYPSESINIEISAIRKIGDKIIYTSNVSINGSIMNASKYILQTFNCTTGINGKCNLALNAPSTYGRYIVELNNFKTFSSFYVIPFSYNIYMKDEIGKSLKNIYALGESGRVEVRINNASDSDNYNFSGYIADSSGNSVLVINSTILNITNSFVNSFLFTLSALTFDYDTFVVYLTVDKTGDGSISSTTSFKVQDWMLSVNKKSSKSGFEYEYSVFTNQTMKFEAFPTFRLNGSVIGVINSSVFNVSIKDSLNNVVDSTNANWNETCGKSGCYEFSLSSPLNTGQYVLYTSVFHGGDTRINRKTINVINGVTTAPSTDSNGNVKDLFGVNEYVYFSLSSYNFTSSSYNLTSAEIFSIEFMNGSEFTYTQVNNFESVNISNSIYEWAWNETQQRIKLDTPKAGGIYHVSIFGNNKTIGTETKFIINPYDFCTNSKTTPGTVSAGYYYAWQFKTTDPVYFEIKLTQANNPLGKAVAMNLTGNGSTQGIGDQCVIDTSTKQVVNNATITLAEITNLESGAKQNINISDSICQASDSSGGYTCTIKPSSKWSGGINIVKFNVKGQDGTTSIIYGKFEARAFYIYGWSQNWQNEPNSNLTFNLRLYEAGNSWWSTSGSSGGIGGTVVLKKIEYQGKEGEWIWPPVDSGYNISNMNATTITNGVGTMTIFVSSATDGKWKTGNYRAIVEGTTTSGDVDYGYLYFRVNLWEVYGAPISCTTNVCNYKNYFNSKDNVTIYVKASRAGESYSSNGGQDLFGNISIKIKKIEDCKSWPCRELNASEYTSTELNFTKSSPWYWKSNLTAASDYILQINSTSGTWGTGSYRVILDVNGTDVGSAWFNTIAFYVDARATNLSGAYVYTIKKDQPMWYNISATKDYKWITSYWNGSNTLYSRYNESDYINVTFNDAILRVWNQTTGKLKEYNYPEQINVTPDSINNTGFINITFLNGNWPLGWYSGEISFKNSDNEISSGYIGFNVQQFRINTEITGNAYNIDSQQCVNASISVYNPDWTSSSVLYGNYSIIEVYENTWQGSSSSKTAYTNYTVSNAINQSFNATTNASFCPNNGEWGDGSWGGYHYLNLVIKDNINNDTQEGGLWFRTIPFTINWTSLTNKLTTANILLNVSLSRVSGANASGNLTKLYQWRSDLYLNEEYRFVTNTCDSAVSGQCTINGTTNLTIFAPSGGWKIGYNYLTPVWTKENNPLINIYDSKGVSFEARSTYNGYFTNSDANGAWKNYFAPNESITIKLSMRNENYTAINLTISSVSYSSSSNCWSESCRTYTSAVFSPSSTGTTGTAILTLTKPSTNWTKGTYYLKAVAGGITVTGGSVVIKDTVPPNISIISPVNNGSYNNSISFIALTSKDAQCSAYATNFDQFYGNFCNNWDTAANESVTSQRREGCNVTRYGYNGTAYYTESVSSTHKLYNNGTNAVTVISSEFSTGGKTHTYSFNSTNWPVQHFGIDIWCVDGDNNLVTDLVTVFANGTRR